jgi:cytoskeletal protein RodZ
MRCPSCQNDIPDNQFYCPICRASVYTYVPENTQKKGGRLERAGKRLLDLLILVVLIGAAVLLARQIKWNELLGIAKPPAENSSPAKTERNSGKQNQNSTNTKKRTETSASSSDPANAKETQPKSEDSPATTTESKTTPKPTATPKPDKTGQ